MSNIHVTSEIGKLKKVLLHRPGNELLNLTPDTLSELLFDDIPFLPNAKKEHDAFAKALKDNGVEVVYLEDLMAETLDIGGPDVRHEFIDRFLHEAGVNTINQLNKAYPEYNVLEIVKELEEANLIYNTFTTKLTED